MSMLIILKIPEILVQFILKLIVHILIPNCFIICQSSSESVNNLKTHPCLKGTLKMFLFYLCILVLYYLVILITFSKLPAVAVPFKNIVFIFFTLHQKLY